MSLTVIEEEFREQIEPLQESILIDNSRFYICLRPMSNPFLQKYAYHIGLYVMGGVYQYSETKVVTLGDYKDLVPIYDNFIRHETLEEFFGVFPVRLYPIKRECQELVSMRLSEFLKDLKEYQKPNELRHFYHLFCSNCESVLTYIIKGISQSDQVIPVMKSLGLGDDWRTIGLVARLLLRQYSSILLSDKEDQELFQQYLLNKK